MNKLFAALTAIIVMVVIYMFSTIEDTYKPFDAGIKAIHVKDLTIKASEEFQQTIDSLKNK